MNNGYESTLADWIRVLLRRWRYVAAITVLIVGVVLTRDLFADNSYESKAELFLVSQPQRSSAALTRPYVDPDRLLVSELRFVKSELVAKAAAKVLGRVPPPVQAMAIGRSNLFQISTRGASPRAAQRATTTYLDSYIRLRQEQQQKGIIAAISELEDSLEELRVQTEGVVNRDEEAVKIRQALLDLRVDLSISKDYLQTVSSPNRPRSPVSPKPLRNALLAFFPALLLGSLFAFLRESLDESITSEDDVLHAVPQLNVLAQIPRIRRGEPARTVQENPDSSEAESYRRLRAQLLRNDNDVRVILITSALRGEGKTTTAANLAFSMAEIGISVLLIDGDRRTPGLTAMFGQQRETMQISENLAFLAAPKTSLAKAGSGEWLRHALDGVNPSCDIVIVDAPPLLDASESVVFADLADGTLMVIGAGAATERQIRKVMRLAQGGAPLLGAVVNGVNRFEIDGFSRLADSGGRTGFFARLKRYLPFG